MAMRAGDGDGGLRPVQPLYDTLEPGLPAPGKAPTGLTLFAFCAAFFFVPYPTLRRRSPNSRQLLAGNLARFVLFGTALRVRRRK